MLSKRLYQLLGSVFPVRQLGRVVKRRKVTLDSLERLENRIVLASRIWDGGGADNLWTTAENWGTDVAPTAGDDLTFPSGVVRLSPVNDFTNTTFNSMTIEGSGYTISGNPLGLQATLDATYGSGTSEVNVGIELPSDIVINVASGANLQLSSSIDGDFGFEKTGAGTLEMDGINGYNGSTTISEGTLKLDGTVSGTLRLNGGTLSGAGTVAGSVATTSNASSVAPGTIGESAILTYSNSSGLSLFSNVTFHVDINGSTVNTGYDRLALTNSSALFNPNGATLDISMRYLPAVNTSFQVVSQAYGSPITGRFNGISQFGSVTSGPVTFSVGYFNSGIILTVTAVNLPTYTWDGGDADDSLWSSPDNWVGDVAPEPYSKLVFPDGVMRLNNTNDFASNTQISSVTIGAAGYSLNGNSISLAQGITASYSSGSSSYSIDSDLSGNQTFTVASGGNLTVDGSLSGTGGITKVGAGVLTFGGSSANSYAGTTSVNDGTLILNKMDGVVAIPGNLVVGNNSLTATVQQANDQQINDASTVTVNEGSLYTLDGYDETINALTMQGSTVTVPTGSQLNIVSSITTLEASNNTTSLIEGAGTLDFSATGFVVSVQDDPQSTVDARISAAILHSDGIVKSGSGIMAFAGSNTYTGTTDVIQGALQAEHHNAFGSTDNQTTISSGASVFFVGYLNVSENFVAVGNGYNTSGALASLSGDSILSGTVQLNGNSQFGASNNSSLSLNGVISDGGSLYNVDIVNASSGRVILGAANTFGGSVSVQSGLLQVGNSSGLGDENVQNTTNVLSGATIELANSITIPATKTLEISGLPVSNSSKVVNLNGDNTIAGNIDITGGNNQAFDVPSGSVLTINGSISGSRDFDKNGTGTLVLTGVNTNTGNVNVGDGTLIVEGSLATSNSVFVDGRIGGNGTVASLTISGIGTLAPGNSPGLLSTGNLVLSAGGTYSVEVNGTSIGTQYDQVDVTGAVDLAEATLSFSLGYSPSIGDAFTIINNDGWDLISNTFNGLPEGSTITLGSVELTISYSGGSNGNDVVLTVTDVSYVWDGGDMDDSLWSSPDNWVGDVAPTEGSRLVFPSGATRLTNLNDFASGMQFHEISLHSSGYVLDGNAITIRQGISTTYNSGSSTVSLDTALAADSDFDIAFGGTLKVGGAITGSGHGLIKAGGGELQFTGSAPNTYSGTTQVLNGLLVLDKDDSVAAIAGALVVGDNSGSEIVRLESNEQISNSSLVSLYEGATLDLNSYEETVSSIGLQGATVLTGTIDGKLTVTSGLSSSVSSTNTVSSIQGPGTLSLNNVPSLTMSVTDDPVLGVDLRISANIADGGISKTGTGTLALSGSNTYTGETTVALGAIQVESADALGTTDNNTSVLSAGSVWFSSPTLTIAEEFVIGGIGGGAEGALAVLSGTTSLTGTVQLIANTTLGVADNSTLNLEGTISELSSSTLTLSQGETAARTVISGVNSYSGGTFASRGTLAITDPQALGTGIVMIGYSSTDPAILEVNLTGTNVISNTFLFDTDTAGGLSILSGATTFSNTLMFDDSLEILASTGASLELSGSVGDDGSDSDLYVNGDGTVIISGTSTHSGLTSVGGNLVLNGSLENSPHISVYGRLSGAGSTAGTVQILSGGTFAPGNPVGTLNVEVFTSLPGATMEFEIGSPSDQLVVSDLGMLMNAILAVDLVSVPAVGDQFTIVDNVGTTPLFGTFDGLAEGATFTIGQTTMQISYVGGTGNDVVLTVTDVTYTWTGASDDGRDWTIPGNWVGNVAPTPGSNLIFPSSPVRTESLNTFSSGTMFNSITIGGSGYDIYGEPLALKDGLSSTGSGTSSFSNSITLLEDQTFTISAGSVVMYGAIAGNFGLTKEGVGTLLFEGNSANTYTGNTVVNDGTLVLNKDDGLRSIAGNLTIGDNVGSDRVQISSLGQLNVTSFVSVYEGAELQLIGASESIQSLTLQGSTVSLDETSSLTVVSTLTTNLTVNNQTAVIQGPGDFNLLVTTITVNDDLSVPVDLRIDANVLGGSLTKAGTGVLALTGDNEYAGFTLVIGGTIQVESSTGLGLDTNATQVIAGASVVFSGTNLSINEDFTIDGFGAAGMNTLGVISGNATLSGDVVLMVGAAIGAADASELTINGTISQMFLAPQLNVVNGATGRVVLSGNNTYSGNISVNSGYLRATSDNAFGAASFLVSITISDTATLELSGGISVPGFKSFILELNGTNSTEPKIVNLSGDNTILGFVQLHGNELISVASGTTLTLSGLIFELPNGRNLIKEGDGTLALNGNGFYTGTTYVTEGTVLVNGSISASAGIIVSSGATLGGTGSGPNVEISAGGKFAPGQIPGFLTVGNLNLNAWSNLEIELDSSLVYDQLNVSQSVNLTDATLSLSVNYSPETGLTSHTIISHSGSDPIIGTFTGLPEGALFTVDNVDYTISYVGGDGNDVVLTSMVGPKITSITPDRGSVDGGVDITITGTDFLTGASVLIGGNLATNVVVVNSTQITATVPAGVSGTIDVAVTNPDLLSSAAEIAFTYYSAPFGISLTNSSIIENSGTGVVVGQFSSDDLDSNESHTYSLISGFGDDDNEAFTIDSNGNLLTAVDFDRESRDSYSIRVRTTDSDNLSIEKDFLLNIVGVNDNGPIFVTPSTFDVSENNTDVANIVATDADLTSQTITYSITGGADQSYFNITSDGSLSFSVTPDFETPGDSDVDRIYHLQVTADDGQGGVTVQDITVNVMPVNDNCPQFLTSAEISVAENTLEVGKIQAFDLDMPEDTLAFTITGGADADRFSITSNGVLTFRSAPDYELPSDFNSDNAYSLQVQVDDGNGGTNLQDITVYVTPINDNLPRFSSQSVFQVAENTTAVATFISNDEDLPTATLSYSIYDGLDAHLFELTSTGTLSFKAAPDFESPINSRSNNVYQLNILIDDGAGGNIIQDITVYVTPVNEFAPVIASEATFDVEENSTIVSRIVATDADHSESTIAYSITGGSEDELFRITPDGRLEFLITPDFESPNDSNGDNVYHVEVTVSDSEGKTVVQAIVVTVTPVNDFDPSFTSHADFTIAENQTVVGNLSATDGDFPSQTLSYTITGGNDAGAFAISNGNVLSFILAPDYENPTDSNEDNVYELEVTVDDGAGGRTLQVITVIVTEVNDNSPIFITSNFVVEENETVVGYVEASDADLPLTSLTYTIAGGNDDSWFKLTSTGALEFLSAPDFEAQADSDSDNVYELRIAADDGLGNVTYQNITVIVTPNNDNSPIITSDNVFEVLENSKVVGTVLADDADLPSQTLTFSITGGIDSELFSISPHGDLMFIDAPDYENPKDRGRNNVYELQVTVTDGLGNIAVQDLSVHVLPVNDSSPIFTSPAAFSVAENSSAVGLIRATDADLPSQLPTFSIAGGDDSNRFTITSDGTLAFKVAPDFEIPNDTGFDNVYHLQIAANDGVGRTTLQNITVTVAGVNDNAPSFTSLSAFFSSESFNEVGKVIATDADMPNSVLTYSITGGVDATKFNISSDGILTFNVTPDYEIPNDVGSNNVYDLQVTADDGNGHQTIQHITVTVVPLNDNAPIFTSLSEFITVENTTAVGTVTATDADLPGDRLVFSIVGGTEAGRFNLSPEGVLTFKTAPDFENPTDLGADNTYLLQVKVDDGKGKSFVQDIKVTVTPVDDNVPSFTSLAEFFASENLTIIGNVVAKDADQPTQPLAYSITGGVDAARFAISSDGLLTFVSPPDFENPTDQGVNNVYQVEVTADDRHGHTVVQDITVTVTAVNDNGPVFSSSAAFTIVENILEVGVTSATDRDLPAQQVTYSITGGVDASRFSMTPAGVLTFVESPDFEVPADEGSNNVYNLQVTARDGNGAETVQEITVTVIAVNDNKPIFSSTAAFTIVENILEVGVTSATDRDLPAQQVTYSITGGVDASRFSMTPAGVLTFVESPDFEAPADEGSNNVYNLQVTARDGNGAETVQEITVTVTAVNDGSPKITSSTLFEVAENTTAIGTLSALDSDLPGQTLTFSVTGGDDADRFTISPSGILRFVNAPNFEVPGDVGANNVYTLQVTVTDGEGNSTSQDVTVTVTAVNDNGPVFVDASPTFELLENSSLHAVVGNVSAVDLDQPADSLTYSIVAGNTGDAFQINPVTGQITIADPSVIDFEVNPTFTLTIQVSDNGLGVPQVSTAVVVIQVTNVVENELIAIPVPEGTYFIGNNPGVVSPGATVNFKEGGSTDLSNSKLIAKISAGRSKRDRLSIFAQGDGPNQIQLRRREILFNGQKIGSFKGGKGKKQPDLTVSLTSNATEASLTELLRSIRFEARENAGTDRVVTFQLTNVNGIDSNLGSRTIAVNLKP